MIEEQEINNIAVDHREETLVTRHPGYTSTEQVVVDVAAERRLGWYLFTCTLWSMLVLLELLLAFRFILRLIAANPDSGFGMLIYGISGIFAAPFHGLIETPAFGRLNFEVTTLIAMLVYGLIYWIAAYLIRMVTDRPTTSSYTRSTREQMSDGDGKERTTHITISNGKI